MAFTHESLHAGVDLGVSSVSIFLEAILKSRALHASTYKIRLNYKFERLHVCIKLLSICYAKSILAPVEPIGPQFLNAEVEYKILTRVIWRWSL